MFRLRIRALAVFRWGLALLAFPAAATTMLHRDVPALSREADAIVVGRVVKAESRWTPDHRRIVTEVTVEVAEALKGTPGPKVVVRQPGGQVGDIGQRVDGMASFGQGEEVLVFLEKLPDDSFRLSGMSQGKYRVERATDGKVIARPENRGAVRLLDPDTRTEIEVKPQPVELPKLKSEIRNALARPTPVAPVPVQKGTH